jgi:hypothetical protein
VPGILGFWGGLHRRGSTGRRRRCRGPGCASAAAMTGVPGRPAGCPACVQICQRGLPGGGGSRLGKWGVPGGGGAGGGADPAPPPPPAFAPPRPPHHCWNQLIGWAGWGAGASASSAVGTGTGVVCGLRVAGGHEGRGGLRGGVGIARATHDVLPAHRRRRQAAAAPLRLRQGAPSRLRPAPGARSHS